MIAASSPRAPRPAPPDGRGSRRRRARRSRPGARRRTPGAGGCRATGGASPLRVAERHRGEGVPVVAAPPGQQPPPLGAPPRAPVLEAHLDRHLHGHRSRVAQEHVAQRLRCDLHQPPGEANAGLVGEPSEHHVAHPLDLVVGGGVEGRVGVAVDGRPPRGHAVHQLVVPRDGLGQAQAHPGGRRDHQRRVRARHGRVGVPHVRAVELEQLLRRHGGRAASGRRRRGRRAPPASPGRAPGARPRRPGGRRS